MNDRTIGLDEAGRGPILGPMVVAVVALDDAAARTLADAGVTDSKALGHGHSATVRRANLADQIQHRASAVAHVSIAVDEIDHYTFRGQLNALERKVARDLLVRIGARWDDRVLCDGALLFGALRGQYRGLVAIDRAELVHPAVAAASIIAKDIRDRAFSEIACRYQNEFGVLEGGGYLNPPTRRFLAAYRQRHGDLPPEARRSWGVPKSAANLSLFEDGG